MYQVERDTVIKSLYVDLREKNIFHLLKNLHLQIQEQKRDLLNNQFSYNDEDVRCKFSVVYTDFRVRHPELYGHIRLVQTPQVVEEFFHHLLQQQIFYFHKQHQK
jgi:hypothetical protein